MSKTKMMEDNIGLIYKYYHMYNIDDDDRRQEIAYAYCRAVNAYDEENSHRSLSTYAFAAMSNRLRSIHRTNSYAKRTLPDGTKYFSLDQQLQNNGEAHSLDCDYFYDVVGYDDSAFDEVIVQDIVDRIRPQLTKTQLKVFDLLVEGNTRNEVAKKLGRSNQAVQQIISRIKNIIMGEIKC